MSSSSSAANRLPLAPNHSGGGQERQATAINGRQSTTNIGRQSTTNNGRQSTTNGRQRSSKRSSVNNSRESTVGANQNARRSSSADTSKEFVLIGKYVVAIQKLVGHGGSAEVYQVLDTKNPCTYALKVVYARDARQLECYKQEALLLKQFVNEPHVIQLKEWKCVAKNRMIAMLLEFADSDFLRFWNDKLEEEGDTGTLLTTIVFYFGQMVQAVHAVHARGIMHFDLKPENFLLVDGRVKLADFGVAGQVGDGETHISRNGQVGTTRYMAPEQIYQPERTQNANGKHQPLIVHKQPLSQIKESGSDSGGAGSSGGGGTVGGGVGVLPKGTPDGRGGTASCSGSGAAGGERVNGSAPGASSGRASGVMNGRSSPGGASSSRASGVMNGIHNSKGGPGLAAKPGGSLHLRQAVDAWALGIILYLLIYGRGPYDHLSGGGARMMIGIADPRMRIQYPDWSSHHRYANKDPEEKKRFYHVIAILQRLLERDPKKRASLDFVLQELDKVLYDGQSGSRLLRGPPVPASNLRGPPPAPVLLEPSLPLVGVDEEPAATYHEEPALSLGNLGGSIGKSIIGNAGGGAALSSTSSVVIGAATKTTTLIGSTAAAGVNGVFSSLYSYISSSRINGDALAGDNHVGKSSASNTPASTLAPSTFTPTKEVQANNSNVLDSTANALRSTGTTTLLSSDTPEGKKYPIIAATTVSQRADLVVPKSEGPQESTSEAQSSWGNRIWGQMAKTFASPTKAPAAASSSAGSSSSGPLVRSPLRNASTASASSSSTLTKDDWMQQGQIPGADEGDSEQLPLLSAQQQEDACETNSTFQSSATWSDERITQEEDAVNAFCSTASSTPHKLSSSSHLEVVASSSTSSEVLGHDRVLEKKNTTVPPGDGCDKDETDGEEDEDSTLSQVTDATRGREQQQDDDDCSSCSQKNDEGDTSHHHSESSASSRRPRKSGRSSVMSDMTAVSSRMWMRISGMSRTSHTKILKVVRNSTVCINGNNATGFEQDPLLNAPTGEDDVVVHVEGPPRSLCHNDKDVMVHVKGPPRSLCRNGKDQSRMLCGLPIRVVVVLIVLLVLLVAATGTLIAVCLNMPQS